MSSCHPRDIYQVCGNPASGAPAPGAPAGSPPTRRQRGHQPRGLVPPALLPRVNLVAASLAGTPTAIPCPAIPTAGMFSRYAAVNIPTVPWAAKAGIPLTDQRERLGDADLATTSIYARYCLREAEAEAEAERAMTQPG